MFKIKNYTKGWIKDWHFWFEALLGLAIFAFLFLKIILAILEIIEIQINIRQWINEQDLDSLTTAQIMAHLTDKTIYNQDYASWIIIGVNKESETITAMANIGSYIFYWFSYFTHDSNILVGIWLLALSSSKIYPKLNSKDYRFLTYNWSLVVTTFITITSVIFTFLLVPTYFFGNVNQGDINITFLDIVSGVVLHIIFPWIFIIYQIWINPMKVQFAPKEYAKRKWFAGPMLLVIYSVGSCFN
ncbi:hypothetical protein ESOMN_v1c04950 [Williamsoniiplasma somnilux]|uniref:Uncharacterized protein n=1 Tax=Williamsoniiplasma somnilux TaxID=215578 RepID=A0A2K8NYK7_9MOLU|nr:hypothetical protein [Williamsoniiplasma somnilux]ATZ18877.1 hypothetical protein ESOMN_v1c04950 [Williamsoniiplasma somnilux]